MRRTFTQLVLALAVALLLPGCVIETSPNIEGPPGHAGLAFFGITYEVQHPYSYWDNNPAIPSNPVIGEYYITAPGIYEFEYFINPYEYWYGTYEVFINPGGPGGSYGRPGYDGADNYFILICDPDGYYSALESYKTSGGDGINEPVIIESFEEGKRYKLTMQKANTNTRPAQTPKLKLIQ